MVFSDKLQVFWKKAVTHYFPKLVIFLNIYIKHFVGKNGGKRNTTASVSDDRHPLAWYTTYATARQGGKTGHPVYNRIPLV